MKKGQTIEMYLAELEAKKKRVEMFKKLIEHVDSEIEWLGSKEMIQEGYYETYTDENGDEKKRYHAPIYKTDENGNEIVTPPAESSYYYEDYKAWCGIKEELMEIL